MALAALGAVAVLDVGSSTAEAAPSVSPFAGEYAWNFFGSMPTISDGGRISNLASYPDISGRVSADGSYSFTVIRISEYSEGGVKYRVRYSDKFAGNMALDADGNIVCTEDTGGSLVWLRQ
jgi:hypothetical protein